MTQETWPLQNLMRNRNGTRLGPSCPGRRSSPAQLKAAKPRSLPHTGVHDDQRITSGSWASANTEFIRPLPLAEESKIEPESSLYWRGRMLNCNVAHPNGPRGISTVFDNC